MAELGTILSLVGATGLGGLSTWLGQTGLAYFKHRAHAQQVKGEQTLTLQQHHDKLTFELLRAAREEVAAARVEAQELKALQLRLIHFDEAMEHIEALLRATDPAEQAIVNRRAQQFLIRMKRFSDAAGALRNEVTVQQLRDNFDKDFPA